MPRCLAVLLLLLVGCASRAEHVAAARVERDLQVASGHAYTRLVEVRFGDPAELAGYLVEFAGLPLGIRDERPYSPGSVLVQDRKLANLGFITPGGHAYAFDADGLAHDRGWLSRDEHVRALLGASGTPIYHVISPSSATR